jgi:hypothetical protein
LLRPGETPTPDNPFRQRCSRPRSGYAVRLERNQCGEDTYLMNSASMKKGERQRVKRSEMIELDCPRYDETAKRATSSLRTKLPMFQDNRGCGILATLICI